jgi:hypothetical protein
MKGKRGSGFVSSGAAGKLDLSYDVPDARDDIWIEDLASLRIN